jgi:hypothetical protein
VYAGRKGLTAWRGWSLDFELNERVCRPEEEIHDLLMLLSIHADTCNVFSARVSRFLSTGLEVKSGTV